MHFCHRRSHVAPHAACRDGWVQMSSDRANAGVGCHLGSVRMEGRRGARRWMFVGEAWTRCSSHKAHSSFAQSGAELYVYSSGYTKSQDGVQFVDVVTFMGLH